MKIKFDEIDWEDNQAILYYRGEEVDRIDLDMLLDDFLKQSEGHEWV
jgi:hypothetical protein